MEVRYLIFIYLSIWGSEDIVFCLFLCVLACGVYPVFVKNLGMSQAWFLSLPLDLMRKGKSKSRKTRPPVNNRRSSFCFHSAAQFNFLLFYILPLLPYFTFFGGKDFRNGLEFRAPKFWHRCSNDYTIFTTDLSLKWKPLFSAAECYIYCVFMYLSQYG